MVVAAPAGELKAFANMSKRRSTMMQNQEIRAFRHNCFKCGSNTFSKFYNCADNDINEHLMCE